MFLVVIPLIFFKFKGFDVEGVFVLWRTKKCLGLIKKLSAYRFFTMLADLGIVFSFGLLGALFFSKKKPLYSIKLYLTFLGLGTFLAFPGIINFIGSRSLVVFSLYFFGFAGFSVYYLAAGAWLIIMQYLQGSTPVPMIQPIIPGVSIPGAPVQKIPIEALVGLVILVIVHEFSHAIVALREKIKVKSVGLVTVGLIPIGAFAEPDEKQMKKTKKEKRMRVYAAGSMANFSLALLLIPVLAGFQLFILPGVSESSYLRILEVQEGSPAFKAGIKPGMIIYNKEIGYLKKNPFQEVTLVTDKGNFTVKANASGMIGIIFTQEVKQWSKEWLELEAFIILNWAYLLNLFVGMFNCLPLGMLDGARILEDLIPGKKPTRKKIVKATSLIILILIVIGVIPYFIK